MSLGEIADAYLILEWLRWEGEPRCGHCNSTKVHYINPTNGLSRRTRSRTTSSARRVWRCNACKLQFSVLTGTVLERTKITPDRWIAAADALALDPNITIRRLATKVGVDAGGRGGAHVILRTLRGSNDLFVERLLWHGHERTER